MDMFKSFWCVVLSLCAGVASLAQTAGIVDEIIFGQAASERRHDLSVVAGEVVSGGMGEKARRLLPVPGERVEGGRLVFTMKVDPARQNYFTARFWGSDSGNSNLLILF